MLFGRADEKLPRRQAIKGLVQEKKVNVAIQCAQVCTASRMLEQTISLHVFSCMKRVLHSMQVNASPAKPIAFSFPAIMMIATACHL